MRMTLVRLLFCGCLLSQTDGGRILGVFIFPSYSHQSVYRAIWQELAVRGHELVIITTNPVQDPPLANVRQIDISFMYDIWKKKIDMDNGNSITQGKKILEENFKQIGVMSDRIYGHPEVQGLLGNHSERFDLLLVDFVYPSMIALSVRFQCPYVGVSSMDLVDPLHMDIGNYYNPTIYPSYFCSFLENLSLMDRLRSMEFALWMRWFYDNEVYPRSDNLVQKYLGDDYPPVRDIAANVSLIFINSNPLFALPRPNIPTVIEVSGLHIKQPKPLPQELQKYLDEARQEVVYFSFGSNIKSHMLSTAMKTIFLEAFEELPYNILWKFEQSNFTNLPHNVKIEKWLPQQDILLHPNVKVFITQGGLQSMEEAIRKRVPLIGIPFIVDQYRNMNKMKNLGLGQVLDKATLTKDLFKAAIVEVVENPKYRRRVDELANILEDQIIQPMEKIVWHLEYVIRHRGITHLRSPLLNTPAYHYLMVDIFTLCTCCLLTLLFILYKAVTLGFNILTRRPKSKIE